MARRRQRRNRLRLTALALATAALLAACGEQRAQMTSSPLLPYLQRKVGRIGFIGLDGNIRFVDQTGARNTPLTEDAGANRAARAVVAYSQPTWSPDGRNLAFARTAVTGRRTLNSSIWVAAADAGEPREVYRSDLLRPIYLYWSPDGARLTMLSQPIDSGSLELGVIEVNEGRYRRLDEGQPYYWSWLPDNSALITHVGGDIRFNDAARLSLVPLDPAGVKSDFNIAPAGFQAPAVSPDGRYMAYVTVPGGGSASGSALVLRELQGPDELLLADVPGFAHFAFAPRGSRIAVMTSGRPGPSADGELTVYDTGAGDELVLPHDDVIAFFWAPNGTRIAYLVPARAEAEGEDSGLEIDTVFAREQGRFYAELRVVNVRRGNSWRVTQFPVSPRFMREQLPFFDQYLRSSSLWSPDSRSLAYPALTAAGTPGIFVSPATGTLRPQLIAEGDFPHWSP